MNEKQKAITEMMVRLEYAMNDVLKDAKEEGLNFSATAVWGGDGQLVRVHFAVSMEQTYTVVPNGN